MADSSPFSFHCMICIEEFDTESRYPVVLPCGHTYVCAECAVRLDRCMECRTPLFLPQPQQPAPAIAAGADGRSQQRQGRTAARGRSGGGIGGVRASGAMSHRAPPHVVSGGSAPSQSATAAPRPPPKQRLPLPKNAVLLSLMEATEIAAEGAKRSTSVSSGGGGGGGMAVAAAADLTSEEEEEEEKIRLGTAVATGVSGTYVVAAAAGLTIVQDRPLPTELLGSPSSASDEVRSSPPHSPHCSHSFGDDDGGTEGSGAPSPPRTPPRCETHSIDIIGNVDSMVNDYWRESPVPASKRDGMDDNDAASLRRQASRTGTSWSPGRLMLGHGDRVQVVSMEDGWAKLARGYGFVHCPKGTELVKVGGSLDKACQLEAMLQSLAIRRNDLKKEQGKIDRMTVRLMKEFQAALSNYDDLTVVVGSTFASSPRRGGQKTNKAPAAAALEERESPPTTAVARVDTDDPRLQKARNALEQSVGMRRTESEGDQDQTQGLVYFARGALRSLYYGGSGTAAANDENRYPNPSGQRVPEEDPTHLQSASSYPPALGIDASQSDLRPSPTHPVPSHVSAGAREWRRRNGKKAAQDIDFRTGLSGHSGLTVSHASHPHNFIDSKPRSFRMMSAHAGLTVPRQGSRSNQRRENYHHFSGMYGSSSSLERRLEKGEQGEERAIRTP